MIWKANVTLAAVIEREGKYLLVEEQSAEGLCYNQPAGHLESDESLIAAVTRETLEESAYHFIPQHLVGIYRWHARESDTTYLRIAFTGKITGHESGRKLDSGILQTLWLSPEEIRATNSRHRSPLVLHCMEDHIAGKRYPLDLLVIMSKKIVVGMSGGVDSSVTALLLKQQGYDVTGLFMKNWEDDDNDEYCSSRQDLLDAVSVADTIGIPIEAVNFSKEYKERVFSSFLSEYRAGRTPNPDILCNAEIKFKAFLDHAIQLGADIIATGHYAQVREKDGLFQLLKAADGSKDQSYFLHRLNQMQLSHVKLPLGNILKSQVRAIAEQHGLPNHAKKDSTGICFIGERPFREFLNRYLPTKPGEIWTPDTIADRPDCGRGSNAVALAPECSAPPSRNRTPEGSIVGQHIGLSFYTIGQRQGLGIGGAKEATGEPWFVCGKDMANNRLFVVQGHDHPALLAPRLSALDSHWISGMAPQIDHPYAAKTRYRQADAPCRLTRISGSSCEIAFDEAQWAVTPGQSVVIYDGEVCLGGAIIEQGHG